MHFESLNIRGFGCLRTRVEFAPDKLNLTIADNEAGKSTLVAAILAAFYGVEDDFRKLSDKRRPHIKNVVPWERPEEFGIELDFVLDNIRWRIERDFANGEVHLYNRDTGRDLAAEFHTGRGRYQIGEKLLDLSVDAFLKSFYLKQEEFLALHEAGDLTFHIQQVATAIEGGTTSAQAIERLRAARDNYLYISSRNDAKAQTNIKVENAIKRLTDEREGILKEIDKLERDRRDLEPRVQRLDEIERLLERLRKERDEAGWLGDLAKINELTRLIEYQEKLNAEVAHLKSEAEQLAVFEQFPASKWEQLIGLQERVSRLEADVAKQSEKLQTEGVIPLEKVEAELQIRRSLTGVTEAEVHELESATARYADRAERASEAQAEVERLSKDLKGKGVDRDKYARLKRLFADLTSDEKRFIDGFRVFFAEAEAAYREQKTRREWIERERGLIINRQKRAAATARTFFLLAAVTILIGGALILITQGEWLGQVLAGLGVVFGAVGAITRGAVSGADTGSLRKLGEDLAGCIQSEDEARDRLDRVGRDIADIASRAGFEDGNMLLSEYFQFDQLSDEVEPLLAAEAALDKARIEVQRAAEVIEPFFHRAGRSIPSPDTMLASAKQLLEDYRQAVRCAEEYKKVKARKSEIETELERLNRDLESNRALLIEILKMGGIDKLDSIDEAVTDFRVALDKHNNYKLIALEKLPRAKQELMPEVDLAANRSRLAQLKQKTGAAEFVPLPEHSEEYYREQAEHIGRNIDELMEERRNIDRAVAAMFERYNNSYNELRRRSEELEEQIRRAETFRADIDTAVQIMSDISREVYRNWASALSEEAAPFLTALNPRYSDLLFDEYLNFTILDHTNSRRIPSHEVDVVLSTGARDEVFLAARLGIARYLSRGVKGPVPVLLDEPLSAVDDDKFLTGMQFFLDTLSRKHQVLVMSCHEERHRWLKEQMPELFEQRVKVVEI